MRRHAPSTGGRRSSASCRGRLYGGRSRRRKPNRLSRLLVSSHGQRHEGNTHVEGLGCSRYRGAGGTKMSRASQDRYRQAGLCIFCGNAPPRKERVSCESCGAKSATRQRRRKSARLAARVCVRCQGIPLVTKQHCEPCRERHQAGTRRRYAVIRNEVYLAYGGYMCACCGETERAFLSIDHINGDGCKHRREVGQSNIYRWLRDHGFPAGFQVLCMNCQWGRKVCGVCPHQTSLDVNSGPGTPI